MTSFRLISLRLAVAVIVLVAIKKYNLIIPETFLLAVKRKWFCHHNGNSQNDLKCIFTHAMPSALTASDSFLRCRKTRNIVQDKTTKFH